MINPAISSQNPFLGYMPMFHKPPKRPSLSTYLRPIICFQSQNPNTMGKPTFFVKTKQFLLKEKKRTMDEKERGPPQVGSRQMLLLGGLGYWVQGFRCFPWLALNFHMANNLNLHPSTLQLVQNSANLPMVAKPFYGIISDAVYIGGAHRIPYISVGGIWGTVLIKPEMTYQAGANLSVIEVIGICNTVVYVVGVPLLSSWNFLGTAADLISNEALFFMGLMVAFYVKVLSWSLLALVPVAREVLPNLIASVLLGNLGASITEVAKDALVAEYGKKHKICGLQSYAFMGLAAGGILGNMIGGFFLQQMPARAMFVIFLSLLSLQLAISFSTREESLGIQLSDRNLTMKSISEDIRKRASDLVIAISDKRMSHPLTWIVVSIAMVPVLSGSIFCYHTQCLKLDPTIIGLSRVIGQLMLLSATLLYNRYWKKLAMRKLIGMVQILYASCLLLDLVLVRQINLKWGISNEAFALCFSGLAEILAQFKLLPFSVFFATLCPTGCEGSLTSFLASALCLSSIISGFLGVGLASVLGITSGDYSGLTTGILIQFLAALVPLRWIRSIPMSQVKKRGRSMNRRARRNRRVGKVVLGSVNAYRRERE